ncbi:hypothetical protein RhiirC2_722297 [Rhizophagus irregularis]|uniref:Uncharacterized protein n=1 Tax=Rhizophagus irregularis TaxID=588596 RepID=A0A2N1M285_9GLOM|nr:hypothetical protein RhiirC2_722297 [Rhizophagus irregularis]
MRKLLSGLHICMDSALSEKMGALDEKMDNYYSEYKKSVKRLVRDVGSLESGLDILDECVNRETVVDLIYEIVPSLISRRGLKGNRNFSYTIETDTSEESDSGKIVEESHGYQSTSPETSPSESNSSESGSSSETSSSKSSSSSGSSSESSSSSETSSSESGSSDSDINEIVKMIKHQRIRK